MDRELVGQITKQAALDSPPLIPLDEAEKDQGQALLPSGAKPALSKRSVFIGSSRQSDGHGFRQRAGAPGSLR
jgi:hypothetical protein